VLPRTGHWPPFYSRIANSESPSAQITDPGALHCSCRSVIDAVCGELERARSAVPPRLATALTLMGTEAAGIRPAASGVCPREKDGSPGQANSLLTYTDLLAERCRTLVDEVRAMLEQSGSETYLEIAGRVTDTGDQSVADMLADMGATHIHRHVRELRDIEAAQARLRASTFGVCIDCGSDTVYERLTAHPTAKRCVQCKSERERSYAHEARPTL
jgi:DnaK suppressor protein